MKNTYQIINVRTLEKTCKRPFKKTTRCMRLRRKAEGILPTGSWALFMRLWQSFLFQAAFPWPWKTPSPDNVNLSTRAKVIQLSPWTLFGACNVPPSWKSIGLLQVPSKFPCFTLNIPLGIKIALERLDVHASFHAFAKVYISQVTKIIANNWSIQPVITVMFILYIYLPDVSTRHYVTISCKRTNNIDTRLSIDGKR